MVEHFTRNEGVPSSNLGLAFLFLNAFCGFNAYFISLGKNKMIKKEIMFKINFNTIAPGLGS